jgi:hypothetical protein
VTSLKPLGVALAAAVALVAGGFQYTTLGPWQYAGVVAMNTGLLLLALWQTLPAIGGAPALLLFAGPTLWWIDKPTTDVLAFSIITVAMARLVGQPEGRPLHRTARPDLVAIALLLVAIVLPVYGQPFHWPSFAELVAVPFDPAIGLISYAPILALVVAIAAIGQIRRRTTASLDQIVAIAAGVALMVSVSQAASLHGDTPGPSRYINWFIPLAIPFLRNGVAWIAASVSAVLCVALFHPATPLYAREPAPLARYLWTAHPGWNNPLPEVFGEVMHPGEDRPFPAATPLCEKLLIAGSGQGAVFPVPCFPADAPAECAAPGALCYANRDGASYRFVRAPGSATRQQGFTQLTRFSWPAPVPAQLRDVLTQWNAWALRPKSSDVTVLRGIHGVRVTELEAPGRLVFILRQATPGARLVFRPRAKTTATLVDGATGATIRSLEFNDEPLSRWEIEIPSDREMLLLSMHP